MRTALVSAFIFLSMGCGATGSYSTVGGRSPIDEQEILGANESNVYDVIKKLRSAFLTSRGPTSLRIGMSTLPRVYVDGTSFGEADVLKQMNPTGIREIRYLDSREATTLYGTGHTSGIILITTK
jgi:hypothetical protein